MLTDLYARSHHTMGARGAIGLPPDAEGGGGWGGGGVFEGPASHQDVVIFSNGGIFEKKVLSLIQRGGDDETHQPGTAPAFVSE